MIYLYSYRLIKGEGDIWDAKIRARRGINASFSLNGVGVVHEELTDLYQENEELKEQVHKLGRIFLIKDLKFKINFFISFASSLKYNNTHISTTTATQVELMRLRQMQVNNRHLKSKHNVSSTSSQVVNSSVVMNNASNDGKCNWASWLSECKYGKSTFSFIQL